MKINNTQKGFGLVPVLLILVLISVVSFAGYYVWNQQSQKNKKDSKQVSGQQQVQKNNQDMSSNNAEKAKMETYCLQTQPLCFDYPKSWKIDSQFSKTADSNHNYPSDKATVSSSEGSIFRIETGIDGFGGACDQNDPTEEQVSVLKVDKSNLGKEYYIARLSIPSKTEDVVYLIKTDQYVPVPVKDNKVRCSYRMENIHNSLPGTQYSTITEGALKSDKDEAQMFDIFKSIRQGSN